MRKINKARSEQADIVVDILAKSFKGERLFRWIYRDDDTYDRLAPRFWRYLVDSTFALGEIYIDEQQHGALLGQPAHTELRTKGEETEEEEQLRDIGGECADRVISWMKASLKYHPMMEVPHWHWTYLGVLPEHQNQKIGETLFQYVFEQKNAEYPFYGEPTSEGSFLLYQRLGFTKLYDFRVGEDGPLLRSIWAPASQNESRLRGPWIPYTEMALPIAASLSGTSG